MPETAEEIVVTPETCPSATGKAELPSEQVRRDRNHWREWLQHTMRVTRGTDSEKARSVAERPEMQSIAREVASTMKTSERPDLSEDVLHGASRAALLFAIKDFDRDSGEELKLFLARIIKLCLESLPVITSTENLSAACIAYESVHIGSSAYHAQKHLIREKKKLGKEGRVDRFMTWAALQGIPGETYEERILTSMIRFMPALLAHVAREFPRVEGIDRKHLVQSFSDTLHNLLTKYDPSYDRNFYRYVMTRMQTPSNFLSQRRKKDAKPIVTVRSDAHHTNAGRATDHGTETVKTDSTNGLKPRSMSQLQQKKADAQLKEESKKKRSKEKGGNTSTPSELEADALAERDARENRVIACVQTYIEGDHTVVNYADALRVLQSTQQSRAQRFARTHLVKHCRDEIPKPEPKKLETASRALLTEAIATFDPPDDTEDHFGPHLARVINTGILEQYKKVK